MHRFSLTVQKLIIVSMLSATTTNSAKMQSICFCLFILAAGVVGSERITIQDGSPIHLVETSTGRGGNLRINYLEAVIQVRHLRSGGRVNFPRSGLVEQHFKAIKAPGDERGHLVASQFSGPPTIYNISPQNARVNRNKNYQSLNTDWFGAECEVAQFLGKGGNRFVMWSVTMSYIGDLNRPNEYRLQARFVSNGKTVTQIDTRLHNPFLNQDSTFWICSRCHRSRHGRQAGDICHKE